MYGFRSPGKSKNHTSRNHDLYTHKCRDFLCNDIYSTRSTRHGRARCALWKRRCPAKNTVCSLGRCRQCRWTRETQPRGRFHNTRISNSGCSTVGVGVHAVQIVKISVAAVGSRPIIGIERHRCFRVADDVGDIERVAGIGFCARTHPRRCCSELFRRNTL